MNQPYVKKFDENGKLLNPIIRRYESKAYMGMRKNLYGKYYPVFAPNNAERRRLAKQTNKGRDNNRKHTSGRRMQVIQLPSGVTKIIHHTKQLS